MDEWYVVRIKYTINSLLLLQFLVTQKRNTCSMHNPVDATKSLHTSNFINHNLGLHERYAGFLLLLSHTCIDTGAIC